ncbi:MAG: hypothetical protein WAW92_03080 [Minisyncoccia bacterium]
MNVLIFATGVVLVFSTILTLVWGTEFSGFGKFLASFMFVGGVCSIFYGVSPKNMEILGRVLLFTVQTKWKIIISFVSFLACLFAYEKANERGDLRAIFLSMTGAIIFALIFGALFMVT